MDVKKKLKRFGLSGLNKQEPHVRAVAVCPDLFEILLSLYGHASNHVAPVAIANTCAAD